MCRRHFCLGKLHVSYRIEHGLSVVLVSFGLIISPCQAVRPFPAALRPIDRWDDRPP